MKSQNLIKSSLVALLLSMSVFTASAQRAEIDDIRTSSDGRTREISVDIDIDGAKNKEVLSIAYFYDGNRNALRTSDSRYTSTTKQLCVTKRVTPRYYNAEYEGFTLEIPESVISSANRNGSRTIYCKVKAYLNNQFIDDNNSFFAINAKGYNDHRYDNDMNLGQGDIDSQVSDMIGGRNDLNVNDLLDDNDNKWTHDNFDNNNFDNLYNDNATDFASVKRRAMEGNASAQYKLATYYAHGKGVRKDLKTAFSWYSKAASNRYVDAYYQVGLCYYKGHGVKRNYYSAARWFRKGEDCNDPKAMYRLGCMYYDGQGVMRSYRKAVELLEESAERGNKKARQKLNEIY